jgi:hypothetical protein
MKFILNQRRNVASIRSPERNEEPDDRWLELCPYRVRSGLEWLEFA